ncbi:MAG: tyrosine-type recombinase/integrase [Proteobacteria bacterium]|nr:tyrosine-type recombinase/integrase [Pseudomonadota bacterium]
MGRSIHKLTALAVAKANKPGARLSDGGNLYLRISTQGVKSWCFMYSIGGAAGQRGRQREIGLGPVHTVTLAEAREKAIALRKSLLDGIDPMQVRLTQRLEKSRAITFDEATKTYIDIHRADWKNPKSAEQWTNTLASYASPVMGRFSCSEIDTELVIKCLSLIWETKTETATRVRGRIEKILDWATSRKYRSGENPARWKGHLEHSLASPRKLSPVEHHAALPYAKIGSFMAMIRKSTAPATKMLDFAILTASRSGEVRGATWSEIDIENKVWTIPAERMKMEREHRVPLSAAAIKILEHVGSRRDEIEPTDYVFPGPKEGKPYSDAAMTATLKKLGRDDITQHGFRSTFRDWAAECTNYPRDVAEMALAHAIGDKVEAAYRRGDLFDKRTRMMNDWAKYCAKVPAEGDNVIPMQQGNAAA